MEKVFVAQKVANKLFATEGSVDQAMTEAAELLSVMLTAKSELGLSTVVGDDAAANLVKAIAALGEARTAMVAVHNELNDVKLRIGIRAKMAGFADKPVQVHTGSTTALREVG